MKLTLLIISIVTFIGCTNHNHSENKNNDDGSFPQNRWLIIGECSTDFNNDKIVDKAYVIQEKKESVPSNDIECMEGQPFYRKELVIKFGQSTGGYKTN